MHTQLHHPLCEECSVPFLIVEVANSHGGSIDTLIKTIEEFGNIDYPQKGIKFQVFHPEMIALPDFEWFSVYEELFIDAIEWQRLISKSAKLGSVWIDVFDKYSVDVASSSLSDIYGLKLQPSVLENYEVFTALHEIDLRDKSLMLNIAGVDLAEISGIVDKFSRLTENIVLQIGFQGYPTKIEDTGLRKINVLKSAFPDLPLCLADHADANETFSKRVPLYGAMLGCKYIEKHVCVDRSATKYDYYSALTFAEIQAVADDLQEQASAFSSMFISSAEARYLEGSLQKPVLATDLSKGDLIAVSDLKFRRTSQDGLLCRQINDLQTGFSILSKDIGADRTVSAGDFRKARIAVVVAARLKSSRLKKKAILPICGVSSVERCLIQCSGVSAASQVILATSTLEEDAVLKDYTLDGTVELWRGDPEDVITRYISAAEYHDVDVVVRVTADCPLVFPEILDFLLTKHFEAGADYTAAEKCAVGTAGEIINVAALRKVKAHFGRAEFSEYMTWYFRNNPDVFKINIVQLPDNFLLDSCRLTLDYPEDLCMFEQLFNALGCDKRIYTASEVIEAVTMDRSISEINNHLTLRYQTDKVLIDLLNEKTKITVSDSMK